MNGQDAEREIQRLRDRAHSHSNTLQQLIGKVDAMAEKIDAQHTSIKDDLTEIKVETKLTNSRVTGNERKIARFQGMIAAGVAGAPFVIFALSKLIG